MDRKEGLVCVGCGRADGHAESCDLGGYVLRSQWSESVINGGSRLFRLAGPALENLERVASELDLTPAALLEDLAFRVQAERAGRVRLSEEEGGRR